MISSLFFLVILQAFLACQMLLISQKNFNALSIPSLYLSTAFNSFMNDLAFGIFTFHMHALLSFHMLLIS